VRVGKSQIQAPYRDADCAVKREHRPQGFEHRQGAARGKPFRHRRGERADGAEQRAGEAVAGEQRRARIAGAAAASSVWSSGRKTLTSPLLG